MRREELLITGVLLAVIALGGYFQFASGKGQVQPVLVESPSPPASPGSMGFSGSTLNATPFLENHDINTATRNDLMRMRGIGESLANAILEYRQNHGPFRSMESLLDVPGIGESRLKLLKERFQVVDEVIPSEPEITSVPRPTSILSIQKISRSLPTPTPGYVIININRATAQEIDAALPGIGPVLAERIVAYRLEHGPYVTVDALAEVKGIGLKRLTEIQPHIKLRD